MNVTWGAQANVPQRLTFKDLSVGDGFRIKTGHGAVYVKVQDYRNDEELMLEVATGKLFTASRSDVERVDVELSVSAPKPYNLYR